MTCVSIAFRERQYKQTDNIYRQNVKEIEQRKCFDLNDIKHDMVDIFISL